MFYTSMKFHENIISFKVIERTQNERCQISKENNSKNVLTRVMILKVYKSTDAALYLYKVS